jgi:asparagine synthase (glutamine-hydrolysing)
MTVQFGRWSFERRGEETLAFGGLREYLAPYGPDGDSRFHDEGIDIFVHHFHETETVSAEQQPYPITASQVLIWDGRLDNREDLIRELAGAVHSSDSDVAIVAAAYAQWSLACLPKLIGDWALSIWDSQKRELVLAKDFLGTRPLFYSVDHARAQWSSILDPLVLFAGRRFPLDREYLAGWFGLFPASHRTPYIGIHSVPPASYVLIRRNSVRTKEFWHFEERPALVYRKDADYEEHFLELFQQAVQRRLRSFRPVVAELSGGMDSSSIVCMADRIFAGRGVTAPRLDTVTYHSSIEPNWNELPYVEKVEAQRGRPGYRIEVRTDDVFHLDFDPSCFMATPGSLNSRSTAGREFSRVFRDSGSRVLLSGIGGDEVLGGAPSPLPQLADLLKQARPQELSKQLVSWALALRQPLFSMLAETLVLFWKQDSPSRAIAPPAWLGRSFLRDYSHAVRGYPRRTHLFGPRPSFQESIGAIEALRRQVASFPLSFEPAYRKAYPYLDRDLLEFLLSVPPDQLVRPNERRSLMRRALAGIVPQELLHRKRKAFVIRGPLKAITSEHLVLEEKAGEMVSESLGIVDSRVLESTLRDVRSGGMLSVPSILRVFAIERWLRNVAHWKVLDDLEACPANLDASRDHDTEFVRS